MLSYADVPKDYARNVLWRMFLIRKMESSAEFKAIIYDACKRDILFYINSFVWTLDPRLERACIPFITYDFQDEAILQICHNIAESKKKSNRHRRYDIGIDKSRDMGATWSILVVLDWHWRFIKDSSFRAISRVEDYVDNPDDDDALFQKLDFIEERLPGVFQVRGNKHDWKYGRARLKIHNKNNRSTIMGESSNENAGRAGRNLAAFRDEEAFAENGSKITKALNQTTRCQIRVSTPNGIGNSFHTAKSGGKIDWITLHWSRHPDKAAGLYSVKDGVVKIIDQAWHDANPGYEFQKGETYADPGTEWQFLRSPWFDGEVDASDSTLDIAQEIQISFLGTGAPYFRADKIALAKAQYLMKPFKEGNLRDLLPKKYCAEVADRDVGANRCRRWFNEVQDGLPPQDTTYTAGIDISAGTGASDSTLNVADDVTKRKIFEFVSSGITPEDFGRLCFKVCEYFSTPKGNCHMAWDGGGHGHPFASTVMSLNYPSVHYHMDRTGATPKQSKKPGIPSNGPIKKNMFGDYRTALYEGSFITHSAGSYQQHEQFVYDGRGGVVHQKSKSTEDKSDTGDQHGDIVTGEVILWLAMRERPEPIPKVPEIPRGSFAWRRKQWSKEGRRRKSMFAAA